ncbi:MAG: hypothetical protein OJF49_000699 [Ktedonobacterales bacterium]|jgi:hypothetical protein|nr:MAG: hypothetical protein OJF49_000699 [Ktedonobacterales bacterium]
MAKGERKARKSIGSRIFGLINPIRDPSLLVAAILTVIFEGSSGDKPLFWALKFIGLWIAVKAILWLLVNFAFSFVYLARKGGWMLRNPRLAWRLIDAMGTEEIIIGGLRPDMFTNDDGALHEGQWGMAPAMMGGYPAAQYGGALSAPMAGGGYGQGYDQYGQYNDYQGDQGYQGGYQGYDRQPPQSGRFDEQSEELRELLSSYSKIIGDWMAFTEEKWRAVSDSQLGWKPLRGRWNGWEEIYRDSFGAQDDPQSMQATDVTARRYENATSKGSAASAVACFLHDMDRLRQGMSAFEGGADTGAPRMGGIESRPPISQRTNKSPIIRNPMIVDADRG